MLTSNAHVIPIENGYSNIIPFDVIIGGQEAKKVKRNKDGSIRQTKCNKVAGISSTVYPFSLDEIKIMIDMFDKHINEATNTHHRQIARRNKLMFLIGINVGLRISDLLTLRYSYFFNEDMSFKEFYMLIPKKQSKQRKFVKIFFNQTVKKAIEDYISEYPFSDLNAFLFESRKGDGTLSERGAGQIIKNIAMECNIQKNINSHSMRKTWARSIYDAAENKSNALVMLQECLRHSNSTTTLKYISIMDEEKKEMYESIELGLEYI